MSMTPLSDIENRLTEALERFEDARDELMDLKHDTDRLAGRQDVLEADLEDFAAEIRNLTAELEEHQND